jgi:hypothetical protein
MGQLAGVSRLVDRLFGVSKFESSKLVGRREAASRELDADDLSWLHERLEEYSELLTYLHDR